MLLTRKTLIGRLKERLANSHSVDIAVAWAGQCNAMRLLCNFAASGKTLKVIVGLAGNCTDPVALQELQRCAQVRIAEPSGGIFHPKFYLFHEQGRRIAWVGSANLTNGGFSSNDELVLEVLDKQGSAERWFSNLWNSIPVDTTNIS
jgi:HKD family nuclease